MPARASSELDELVRRIQVEGPTEELESELFRRLYPSILKLLANRPGLRDQAEDLAQETMQRIFKSLPAFRFEASVTTWARRIAANAWANADRDLRAVKRYALEVPLDEPLGAEGPTPAELARSKEPSPEEQAAAGEVRRQMMDAVQELPDRMRRCWLLREIQGLSEQETADVLGVTVGTVKSQTHEARKRLRSVLPDDSPDR